MHYKKWESVETRYAQTATLSLSIFCNAQLALSEADESQQQRQHQHTQFQSQSVFPEVSRWSLFLTLILTFIRFCVANDAKQKMDKESVVV